MASRTVSIELSVTASTDDGEVVCVVGNVPQLGSWSPHNILVLTPNDTTSNGTSTEEEPSYKFSATNKTSTEEEPSYKFSATNKPGLWSLTVSLPVDREEIQYRFAKAYTENSHKQLSTTDVMLTSWESHHVPRTLTTAGMLESPSIAEFGDICGIYKVDRGWLTGQTEIRLRLHNNPVQLWRERYKHHTYSIKCTPIDLRNGEVLSPHPSNPDEDSNHDLPIVEDAPPITVSVLRDSLIIPHKQPLCGTIYKENDYMSFRAQTFYPDAQGYQFDVFIAHPATHTGSDTPKHIGTAYLLPMNLDQMTGIKSIPITGLKQKPIGYMKVEYLIIETLQGGVDSLNDLSVSYARHWTAKRAVNVGHRGLGATYCHGIKPAPKDSPKRSQTVKENTIASLSEAYGHGADFVEFDVQLSKDKVPVIYHDLAVGLSIKTRTDMDVERFEVAIKDITVQQLPQLKVKHLAAKASIGESSSSMDILDTVDEQPFPTLRHCLDRIPANIGFNIEIKYCMPIKAGGNEQGIENFMERNEYLDVILSVVMKYAGSRRIIFSCFDPDICTMVRVKQPRYPVLFLCSDIRDIWPAYLDVRTQEVSIAAAFCASEQLLGVNVATDDLLNRPDMVERIKALGLVSFCWGHDEETNSQRSVAQVKALGVDGVIYDKIHEMAVKRPIESEFEIDRKTFNVLAKSLIDNSQPKLDVVTDLADDVAEDTGETNLDRPSSGLQQLSFAGRIHASAYNDS